MRRAVVILACAALAATLQAQVPVTTHPRLWFRADDLTRLRSWAVDSNPVYRDGLAPLAARAKEEMDAGTVPRDDTGISGYVDYPTEMYAELFAFMSLISDEPARTDYANRARTLLMYVMNEAAKGVAAAPFRSEDFSVNDRSRWHGEAYALVVDWIYPTLTSADKQTIRQVFLRWADEMVRGGYHHPEPVGVVNDSRLLADPIAVRWAGNNYFTAHMRNLGQRALAFDAADDPDGALAGYLRNAIGAWLYMHDNLLRNDSRGGLGPEASSTTRRHSGTRLNFCCRCTSPVRMIPLVGVLRCSSATPRSGMRPFRPISTRSVRSRQQVRTVIPFICRRGMAPARTIGLPIRWVCSELWRCTTR